MTMRLERIRLKTFGCFEQQDFDLSDGINLIFGPNFSGKSTLVNAIFFTLTGKPIVPRVDASAMKNPEAYSGTAGLQFVEDGKRYMLYRATKKRIQLRHQENGKWYIDFDETRVKAPEIELQKRFGIMHDRLALTTFLREGEIFEFLARQPATRRDILYALLGIDRLIDVRERFIDARRIAKREENRVKSHQKSLRFNAQNTHKADIEKIEAKLKRLEAAYTAETGDTDLIAEWMQTRNRLQTQLETLIRERVQTLTGFTDIAHIHNMIAKIQNSLKDTGGLAESREQLIQKIGSVDSQITALTNVCNTLRTLLDSDESHCPTCHQTVEQEVVQRIIEEKQTETAQLQTELAQHKKTLAEKTENLDSSRKLEERLQTLQINATRLEQLERDMGDIQTQLQTLTTRLTEKGIPLDGPTPASEGLKNVTAPVPDKRQLKTQIDNERAKLDKLRQAEAVRVDRFQTLQRINKNAVQLEKTRLSLELACAGVDKTIETLQRQILKPAEDALHNWLEHIDLFGSTRIDLQRQHLLPSLTIDGVDRSLMLLSGSEKMFLYLCFKVALAKVLGSPGFFVFDDPTLHLDSERKASMMDFISELAKAHQVVVTSYDEEVRAGLADAHLIEMNRAS